MLILKRKDIGKSLEDIDKGKFRDVKLVTKYYANCRKHANKRQRSPYNLL